MVPNRQRKSIAFAAVELATFLALFLLSSVAVVSADSNTSEDSSALTVHERARVARVPYSGSPLINRSGFFDTRFSAPADTVWKDIYKRPRIISLTMTPVPGSSRRAVSDVDVEATFPIEAIYLFQALANYSAYPRILPRTVYDGERSTRIGPMVYHKRIQKISATFLGFGETFLFVTNNYESRLGRHEWGLKWNLEKSLDGKFFSLTGSWYVQEIQCGSTPCSYLRYFNRTGFTDPIPIPLPILRFFTSNSFRSLLVDFYHAAVRIRDAERHPTS